MLSIQFSTSDYPNELHVIELDGNEGISVDYQFTIRFKVKSGISIVSNDFINNEGTLTFTTEKEWHYQGIITEFHEVFSDDADFQHYKIVLGSCLSLHKQNHRNNIFVDQTPVDTLCEVLDSDFHVNYHTCTSHSYPNKSFLHQYKESNFNFLSRLCEHWGIYYYFDRLDENRLVFADDTSYLSLEDRYLFHPNVSTKSQYQTITHLEKKNAQIISGVQVEGRNPEFSSQLITESYGDISDENRTLHLNGLGIDTKEEAAFLAQIRLENAISQQAIYEGQGYAIGLLPGFIANITLPNQSTLALLITEVQHQAHILNQSSEGANIQYQCSFKGIPADSQFRPNLTAQATRAISSTARIHSDFDDNAVAHRDEWGRYKVQFDYLSNPKVSHWIRKTQTAAKDNHLDIPLLPNTEVQIGYLGGNPDLPFIVGAIENSESPELPGNSQKPETTTLSTTGMLNIVANRSISQSAQAASSSTSTTTDLDSNQKPFTTLSDPSAYQLLKDDGHFNPNSTALNMDTDTYNISSESGQHYKIFDSYTFNLGKNRRYHFGSQYQEYHSLNPTAIAADHIHASALNPNRITEYEFQDQLLLDLDKTVAVDAQLGQREKQVGIVRKIFGNRYNFHDGNIVTVRQNSADDTPHKTVNYGPRYVENIANDSITPSLSFTSGFPSDHTPSNTDHITRTSMDQYKYNEGKMVRVHQGEHYIKRIGNTERIQEGGSSKVTIDGTVREKYITVTGHSKKIINAASVDVEIRASDMAKTIYGNRRQHILGSDNSLVLGAKTSLNVGPTVTVESVTSTKIIGALKTEVILGPSFKYMLMPEYKKTKISVEDVDAKIESVKASVNRFATNIEQAMINYASNDITLYQSQLMMLG